MLNPQTYVKGMLAATIAFLGLSFCSPPAPALELKKIIRAADQVTYKTPDGQVIKGYVNVMRHFRRSGNTEASLETYSRIVPRVESLLRRSMKRVESRLSTYSRIKEEGLLQNQINQSAKSQQSNELNELLEIN